ncbi:MAG TPA: alkaline phosphatase family protein, partial [Opitutales bacterium]|nr:alkaline phosphatase family protein [Opitutales bacterium]
KMPAVASLLEQGAHGNLATLTPVLSPMLWTSIATGQRPFKHGIHGFTEPAPDGQSVRPITVLSRKVKAMWNILNQNGVRTNVVGWWPSHPAEPLDGVMISNHYQRADVNLDQPWPIRPGQVHPVRLVEKLEPLRLHPAELGEEHLLTFVPKAAEIDQQKDQRLVALAKTIADCTNIQAAATYLLQHEPADFTAVYFDAIDHFGHGFMRYHPPRMPWVPEADFELYKDVIESGYRYHDLMLGVLLDMVGPDCTVILMSDHGFHSDHLRPARLPLEPTGPAEEHRPYGIFAIRGPGIKRGEAITGASLLDVAPTILHLFNLALGRDMDGRVLVEAFVGGREPQFIPTWEAVHGPKPDGRHPPETVLESGDAQAALEQLVALGYIEKPSDNIAQAVQDTLDELHYNLARSYMDAGLHVHAVPLFEDLAERHPEVPRHGLYLIRCLLALGRSGEAATVFERVVARKRELAVRSGAELKKLQDEKFDPEAETDPQKKQEAYHRLRKLRGEAGVNESMIHLIRGTILQAEGKKDAALAEIEEARKLGREQHLGLQLQLGEAYLALARLDEAEAAFNKVIKRDAEHAEARYGLARVLLAKRSAYPAAAEALAAVELQPFFPAAHFALGVALQRLRQPKFAVDAFKTCVRQNPNHVQAHARLGKILPRLRDPGGGERHQQLAREARQRVRQLRVTRGLKPLAPNPELDSPALAPSVVAPDLAGVAAAPPAAETITVVSGLPRSGTSLVMQMLEAGGFPLCVDGQRAADAANPRGYYEHEKVKSLARDSAWLGEVCGKAIKIVAPLLPYLPRDHFYRVIFVDRDLEEVLASQAAMLKAQGRASGDETALRRAYRQQSATVLGLLARHPRLTHLVVRHRDLLAEPAAAAARINAFLDGTLDEAAMARVVDPALHRQRRSSN